MHRAARALSFGRKRLTSSAAVNENGSVHTLDKLRRPRTAMFATVAVGTGVIVVDAALGGGRSSYHEPALYVGVQTTEAFAGFVAAYLLFFRFRQNARLDVLLIAVGLAILSTSNLFYGAIPVASATDSGGPPRFRGPDRVNVCWFESPCRMTGRCREACGRPGD